MHLQLISGIRPMNTTTDTSAVLAQWEADETLRRQSMFKSGVSRPDQVAGLSGAQVFEKLLSGELPYPPINDTSDFILVECAPLRAVFIRTSTLVPSKVSACRPIARAPASTAKPSSKLTRPLTRALM